MTHTCRLVTPHLTPNGLFESLSSVFRKQHNAITASKRWLTIWLSQRVRKQPVLLFLSPYPTQTPSDRTQCLWLDGISSRSGVPHGSVFGPLLFTIYVYSQCQNAANAQFSIYADDAIIYRWGAALAQSLQELQSAFCSVESESSDLKLLCSFNWWVQLS